VVTVVSVVSGLFCHMACLSKDTIGVFIPAVFGSRHFGLLAFVAVAVAAAIAALRSEARLEAEIEPHTIELAILTPLQPPNLRPNSLALPDYLGILPHYALHAPNLFILL
jgi:hypothetical protein